MKIPTRRTPILRLAIAMLVFAFAGGATAREVALSPHDPRAFELVVVEPGVETTTVRTDIVYGEVSGRQLRLDMATPRGPSELRPAIVFISGVGDDPAAPIKNWALYRSWMRTMAARGYVAFMGETDGRDVSRSLELLFAYIDENAGELGVDRKRLGAFASAGNVAPFLPFAMGEAAPAGLRALVLLYGGGEVAQFRPELPAFLVIPGNSTGVLLAEQRALAKAAVEAGAGWVVAEARGLAPAFDAFDPGSESRAMIAQLFAFFDARLKPLPPPPSDGPDRAAARNALRQLYAREFEPVQEFYNELSKTPARRDRRLWENLAWARRGLGLPGGEAAALEQAILLAPEDVALRWSHARVLSTFEAWSAIDETLSPVATRPELDAVGLGLLGLARLHLDRPAEAIDPLERAAARGADPANHYNLACAYSRVGRIDDALAALEQAIDQGFDDGKLLAEDADLEPVRADPRFQALTARLAAPTAIDPTAPEPPKQP